MNEDRDVIKLLGMIRMLNEDAVNNGTFQSEDLELINKKTADLQEQLEFWTNQGNKQRFCYELKNHINWFLKTFSEDE